MNLSRLKSTETIFSVSFSRGIFWAVNLVTWAQSLADFKNLDSHVEKWKINGWKTKKENLKKYFHTTLLLLLLVADASKGLKNLTLSVYPEVIRRGQSAQLHCSYEVYDVPLYSVKWYRGIFEFYRYTPFEHPAGKTFFFNTGIKVDVSLQDWIMFFLIQLSLEKFAMQGKSAMVIRCIMNIYCAYVNLPRRKNSPTM